MDVHASYSDGESSENSDFGAAAFSVGNKRQFVIESGNGAKAMANV
jgi:hypothetical protein